MSRTRYGIAALAAAVIPACSGYGSSTPDASVVEADAAPQHVHAVACTGTPPLVTTPGMSYSPQQTAIPRNGLVEFTLGATHNVASTTPGQIFSLPFGAQNACLKFDEPGTYTFKCTAHGFTGSVVVQP